jgi:hypothetical protein
LMPGAGPPPTTMAIRVMSAGRNQNFHMKEEGPLRGSATQGPRKF